MNIIDDVFVTKHDVWRSEIQLDKYVSSNIKILEGFFNNPKKMVVVKIEAIL